MLGEAEPFSAAFVTLPAGGSRAMDGQGRAAGPPATAVVSGGRAGAACPAWEGKGRAQIWKLGPGAEALAGRR